MRALALIPLVAACSETAPTAERLIPDYLGVETALLADDLVNFRVSMTNAVSDADVANYAECAAAGYTLIRGFGFAQHVRTVVSQDKDIWLGDAFYTVSNALPPGVKKLDAEVVAASCSEKGIPTV